MRWFKLLGISQGNARKESDFFSTRERAGAAATVRTTHKAPARKQGATSTQMSKRLVTLATALLIATLILSSVLMFSDVGGDGFASAEGGIGETARVGAGIGAANGEAYAYSGVNSMVGTLISWGADNYTTTKTTVGSWYIDNNGYIAWGSSGKNYNPDITYAVPKNNSLSKIQLIKATNGATSIPGSIQTANGRQITIDNLVSIEGGLGSYFMVGANGRISAEQMAEDWEKAIVAASHYSKSGILQNTQFGSYNASIAETEFPEYDEWATDYNGNQNGGFGKQQNTTVANNTYIYIKLMADWTAPVVNTMTLGGTQTLPGDSAHYLNRFVVEAKNKTAADAQEEAAVQKARPAGFFEFDLGSNGGTNSLQMGSNGSLTNPSYTFGADEGVSKESGPHFSLGTSFSNRNSISNLNNKGITYNQFAQVPSEEPFSFGRLAIPDNCYVIVDLNGHKLDRNLDAVDQTIHGNVICPSVFLAGLYSRLEVFDSTATESNPAGNGKIMGATGINGDAIIDGCPPDYATRRNSPAWDINAWGNSLKGGGVKLAPRAEFTLHSGTITQNSAVYGGAIYGTGNNYIYIYDGVMTGNTACKGGATYLSDASQMVFNMFGGSISGNGADWRRFTRYIHVKDATQVDSSKPSSAIPTEWQASGAGTGVRSFGENFNKEAWNYVKSYSGSGTKQNIKSGEINSEGGGVCVFQNAYFNMYGGSISNNYSLEYAGGVNVNKESFFKMYGGEITGNVVTGEEREIIGAEIVSDSDPEKTETPKANVGGGGVNMFQDSAGIYLNGPGKIMDNYTCTVKFDFGTDFSTESISNYLTTNNETLADSNLYLSLTMTDHTQVEFTADKHLYPEIKVQGPLYIDAQHAAQISITPAAGIEAGGYIMRDFYKVGWEDSSSKQYSANTDGNVAARYLGADETSHAKDQINVDGRTEFNALKYLKTGAQAGYPDGFLFTDGGTSIVGGTGANAGWLIALGTKDANALPVQWQYYDASIDPLTDQPYGWLNATTSGPEGTSFVLTYNGTNRIYDIRVRIDRSALGEEASTSRYYYLYYDYFTTFTVEDGKDVENEEKHYFELKGTRERTHIFTITAGIDLGTGEPYKFEDGEVKYVSERYDPRNGYRFSINKDIDRLEIPGGGQAFPFTEADTKHFQPNPDYCGMKIVRATLQLARLNLGDVERYYDGTKDFYIPSTKISQGSLTGYAAADESNLLMQFKGEANGYVKGELASPNVGQNSVQLAIKIAELGLGLGTTHDKDHDETTFPDQCLLANYEVYDQNSNTTTPAENANIPITLNVNVQPKPITLNFVPQTVEYGSIPVFGKDWDSIADQPDCSLAYKTGIESLFNPASAQTPDQDGFDPNALGRDGKFAKEDIELYPSDNKALATYQILGLSFQSTLAGNSAVGTYNYNMLYSNSNYAVTYSYNGEEYHAIQSGTAVTTVVLNELFTVTPRNILLVVENKSSVYGETPAVVSIADQRHLVAQGARWKVDELDAIISGDSLQAEVNITAQNSDYNTGTSTGAMKVNTYHISLVKGGSLNANYSVRVIVNDASSAAADSVHAANANINEAATYTVTARKITISVDALRSVYGDDLVVGWQNSWSATPTEDGLTGDAILNNDKADFAKAVSLAVSTYKKLGAAGAAAPYDGEIKNAGEYGVKITYKAESNAICSNYDVTPVDGTYTVEKRAVTLTILSSQTSVYGEQINLATTGKDSVWMETTTTNGNLSKGIIISEDESKFESGIVLQFAYFESGSQWSATWDGILSSGKHVPAGQYAIIGTATSADITDNYDISWFGAWSATSNSVTDYARTDLAGKAGYYTVSKRSITVRPVTLSTEFGDNPIDYSSLASVAGKLNAASCGVDLNGGDVELINGGYLPTAFWTATSSLTHAVLDGDTLKIALATFSTNATKASSVGMSYVISADSMQFDATLEDNANYDATFSDGTYTVTARQIRISSAEQTTIYGLLSSGNYAITFRAERVKTDLLYADDDPHAFVETDRNDEPIGEDGNVFTYTKALSVTGSVTVNGIVITLLGYESSLTGSYLNAGTHQLSVTQDGSLGNYNIDQSGMASQYIVLKRAIIVLIEDQSAEYSGQVPAVGQQPDTDWKANGFNKESALYTEHGALAEQLTGTEYILRQDMTTASVWISLTSATLNANYGSYKIEGNCQNNNYEVKFVGSWEESVESAKDGTGGTFYITHIQIDAYFTGYEETKETHTYSLTYDRQNHKLGITLYAMKSARLPAGEEYTVVYSYTGFKGTFTTDDDTSGGTHNFSDVGTYTVTITLIGDAATNYQFGDEEATHVLTLTFTITKATVSVRGLDTVTFNRAVYLPNITFVNSALGNDAVPQNEGANKEWGVYYTPQNKWQINPMPRQDNGENFFGMPCYADVYDAYVMLLGDAQGNFRLEGATSGSVTLTGDQLIEGSVDVITANDPDIPNLEKLSGGGLTFAEGCLLETTYTINQLEIMLIKSKTSNVFDNLIHLNDALEVIMQSVGTNTALNDVPYKVVIYRGDEVYAVFHYGLATDHSNHAHLGACSPECDGTTAIPHHHLHFDFEHKIGDNPTADNNGHIVWTDNNTDVWSDHDKINAAFTNAGAFTLKLVLDNYNYKINDGKQADAGLAPDGAGTEPSLIQKDFTYAIEKAILNPYLTKSDADKDKADPTRIEYDTLTHKLGVWFTCANGFGSGLEDVLTKADVVAETEGTYINNYRLDWSYTGWEQDLTDDGYKNVGTYAVQITLSNDSNFAFAGGNVTTLTFEIVAYELQKDDIDFASGFRLGDDNIVLTGGGNYVYTGVSVDAIAQEFELSGDGGTYKVSRYGRDVADAAEIGYSVTVHGGNGIDAGTYLVTVQGMRNFTGTIELTFVIQQKDLGNIYDGLSGEWHDDGAHNNDDAITETGLATQEKTYTGTDKSFAVMVQYNATLPDGSSYLNNLTGSDYDIIWFKKVDGSWQEVSGSVKMRDAGDYRVVIIAKHSDDRYTGNYTGAYVEDFSIDPSKVVLRPSASEEVTEGKLSFVYNGTSHVVNVTFNSAYATPGVGEYETSLVFSDQSKFSPEAQALVSVNAGNYVLTITLTSSNFVWDDDQTKWTEFNAENSVAWKVENANTTVHVTESEGATVVTITYAITPATVRIDDLAPLPYNRAEQEAVIRFSNLGTASIVPTSYNTTYGITSDDYQPSFHRYDPLTGAEQTYKNARLGSTGKPYYAGNYDVTVTLTGDDAFNFVLEQQTEYTFTDNSEEKSVEYTDDGNTYTATALVVITQVGVYTNPAQTGVIFDNVDHFHGDPAGFDGAGRYDGTGPWTIIFSSMGTTPVEGISYNISFKGKDKDGNDVTVIVKIGGYSHSGEKVLANDSFYLYQDGEIVQQFENVEDTSEAYEMIKGLGLFTNAGEYTYTLSFEFANFYISENYEAKVSRDITYTISAATIGIGSLMNKTFNNHEQEPDFDEHAFNPVGDTKLSAEQILGLLNGYNAGGKNGGFTYSYTADGGNAALSEGNKPFNAGTYTVTVTLHSGNFTFSGSETATMTFTIDPFDISSLDEGQFVATLPDVRYTGMPMKTYLKQVVVHIGDEEVTLVLLSTDATDGKLQLGKDGYDFTIASYDNNVNASTDKATAHIVGSNNFAGELTRIFKILSRQVHVNIQDNMGNVYGVNPNSGVDKPSNLGDVRDVDWSFDGDDTLKSADDLTAMIEASVNMTYGGDDTAIQKAIEAFDKLNGESADKFVYDGDNLYVTLHVLRGVYNNNRMSAEHSDLLVGKWPIIGSHTNSNYEVTFSGNYATSGAPKVNDGGVGDEQYGCYEVVQRSIVITPADLGITYGEAEHTYSGNLQEGKYLFWTATSDYAGDAILAEDLAVITAGISLEIDKTSFSASGWLNVGTYLIKVVNIGNIGTLAENTNASSVTECYTIKGSGTWVDGAMGAAVEAVSTGIGGTYTVTARNITVQIQHDVMRYEYDHEEPYNDLDTDEKYNILKYMLEVAKKEGGVAYTYDDLVALATGDGLLGFATARDGGKTADNWSDLNLKFIKDAGVDAASYSVDPSYSNANYNVTFEGYSNSVTIDPRKIVVHINDKTSVYGEEVIVGMAEGQSADWYAMLAKTSTYYKELEGNTEELIRLGRLNDDVLNVNITKEFGANVGKYYLSGTYANNNYEVTFEGSWTAEQSTTTGKDGDPGDNTAGIFEIKVRPVTVTILGQSGVYGGNQHLRIGVTENTHWSAEQGEIGNGENRGVVNNDSLGINITIIYDSDANLNKNSNQLNSGWYSVRVSYNNPNYNVTFVSSTANLNSAEYVKKEDYAAHSTSDVTDSTEAAKGDEIKASDVSNAYYIYARVISITVQPQSFTYNGAAPAISQSPSWWTANNVINGDMPAILDDDVTDFNNAIKLVVVAPVEGDPMYAVWKEWGMWSAGLYENKCGLKATLNKEAEGVDESIFTNYELVEGESSVLGALRINPAEISVMHNQQSSTYNKDIPTIDQARSAYEITGATFSSYRWNGSAFDVEATADDNTDLTKNLLKFVFTYDDGDGNPDVNDYGAGRHFIQGAWDGDPNPNYTVTFNAGTFTIIRRELVVTLVSQYAIYGEKLWEGENWWLEVADAHGTKTPNPKYWSVAVTNYNDWYEGGESIYWVDEDDRTDLRITAVIGAKQGANAATYTISGSWNSSNDDYNVTFNNAEYVIHKRAIKVHINDQGGVYGGNSFGTAVDQNMGNGPDNGGYYVVGFDSDEQNRICKGHECAAPKQPFVIASDNLNIVLTLGDISTPGEYDIRGECKNNNYAVTFVGGEENREEASGWDRDHGTFGITKRQVTVRVQDQNVEYGTLKNGETTGFNANGYTAQATNDTVNRNAFITSDNVVVELSVTVTAAGEGNYNKAGNYIIHIRIYEGGKEGKLIYSSLQSETATASDKYELTVGGAHNDEFFGGKGEVHGTTGAYIVTKKQLVITVADKSSIYGEALETLTCNIVGAMDEEAEHIRGLVSLTRESEVFNDWDGAHNYLRAGTYHIAATLDDEEVNNNYAIVFRTSNGADYKEAGPDGRGEVTAIYTVEKRRIAINITFLGSVYGEALQSFSATLSPVGAITGDPILEGDRTAGGDKPLGISFEIIGASSDYNLSSTNHLKAGIYPIMGSWSSGTYTDYELSFTGIWTADNTAKWFKQATQNESLYDNVSETLERKVGVYTVSVRPLRVKLGTNKAKTQSEYGDDIVDFDVDGAINTDKSWGVEYQESAERAGLVAGDNIVFDMTTTARKDSPASTHEITYPIKAINIGVGDNANYDIKFDNGTYIIKPREMTVTLTAKDPKVEEKGFSCAVDVYGTTYDQEAKFSYGFTRTHPQGADNSFYNGESIELVITPWKNEAAQDAKVTDTGFYPVGTYSLALSAKDDSNYSFTSMEGSNVRYKVTPRPITIYLNDQHSVYGETINVDSTQGDNKSGGWYVKEGEIIHKVEDPRTVDDLGITITKDEGIRWRENGYMLTASATNGNYEITWQGSWDSDGDTDGIVDNNGVRGTYTIDKRLLLIRIYNQYSIYGETVRVSSEADAWEVVDPKSIDGGEGTYYTLMDGQSPDIKLNIYTVINGETVWYSADGVASSTFKGIIGRGEYHIGVQTIGNGDYDVEVEEDYLPDVSNTEKRKELISKYPGDFGETTTLKTIEVKNHYISPELAAANNATYFVTIRPITIKIHNQNGTYGDYLTLKQGEGESLGYTIELGPNTTNSPFVGDYKATFDLVTNAFKGWRIEDGNLIGVNEGWSENVNVDGYPIFGSAYHVFDGERKVEDNSDEAARLSHNYQFNFEGAYANEGEYPSGNPYSGCAGVYTVDKRQISLTVTNSSAVYGGVDNVVRVPTLDQSNYTAINGNSKTPTHDDVTHAPIISEEDKKALNIRLVLEYKPENLSSAKALKVGHYTIRLDYDENDNYEITAVNNGDFEVLSRQASILIVQSAATATYLAAIPSEWAVKAIGDYAEMYQLSNVLDKDIIAFTMTTTAKAGNSVGHYTLSGSPDGAADSSDNGNYSITFTSGTFEITKKSVDVMILDQSSIYGDKINVNAADKWKLPVGWNIDGEVTNNDAETALNIVLSTTATERTDVGRYQITGSYDINGEVGKNYDLHFVGTWNASEGMTDGDGGTLTINPRDIVIVIKAQTITYRDVIDVDQHAWFAWRGNNTATWTPEGGTDNAGGVLGPKDTLDALRVSLTQGNATDMDTYGPNTGARTYFGTYAIMGSSMNTNYSVVFAYERLKDGVADDDFDYSSVKENEDGVFTIAAYEITIEILNLGGDGFVGYGGTDYVKNGGALYFGAELINTQGTIWRYAGDGGKSFLSTELNYLSFRLGGDYSSEVYAFKGQHPIVGYWCYGLDDPNATDYRMQFNYKVTFTGEWTHVLNDVNSRDNGYDALYENSGKTKDGTCGVFTISNANVSQLSYSQTYDEGEDNGSHWHGNNWNREAAFSGNEPDNPKHSMGVNAEDLFFAGNVLFGGGNVSFLSHINRALQQPVVVTYSDLQHDSAPQVWADSSKAPEEQAVGKWTVQVHISAPYHDEIVFTLTLTITRIDITIYLNEKEIPIPYGYYQLIGNKVKPTDDINGAPLNDLLKQLLFKAYDKNEYLEKDRMGGPIVSAGTDGTSDYTNIVQYLLRNSDVQVSISTRATDASTGGYLIAQKYMLTISAGENMSIRFGSDYNNVRVTPQTLTVTWEPDAGYDELKSKDGEYVYKFAHKNISVVPRVTKGDVFLGDLVLLDSNDISTFSVNIYRVNDDGGQSIVNAITDVGKYKIEIVENITPTLGKNVDISNYTTPVGECVYVIINRAEVTIIIKDQTSEYGDNVTLGQDGWWYVKTGDSVQDRPDSTHPNTVPGTGEDIAYLGITLSFAEGPAPFNVGSYAIYGSATTTNYTVVFEGSFGDGTQGKYEITKRTIMAKVNSYNFTYGDDIPANLADDANGYTFVHLDGGDQRPAEIAVLPGDNINFVIAISDAQKTATGYIKAGTWHVTMSYDNANYAVSFADSDGDPLGSSYFDVIVSVGKRVLNVEIQGKLVSYGDLRPAMPQNYHIYNLATADTEQYIEAGLDRPSFIDFEINNANTGVQLTDFPEDLAENLRFDPVGVYVIIGHINDKNQDVSANYIVNFAGEWSAYGEYTSDEYVGKASKYEVVKRELSIIIRSVTTEYGDVVTDVPFDLIDGYSLAGNDTKEGLMLSFITKAIIVDDETEARRTNNVGEYTIDSVISGNDNYYIKGTVPLPGTYTITPRNITIEVFSMTHLYGDNHLAWLSEASYDSKNWTAHRSTAGKEEDPGIAYPRTDAIVGQIELTVNGISDRSAVNDYTLTYRQIGNDENYNITGHTDATYSISKRPVKLTIKQQSGEYGNEHVLTKRVGDDFSFELLSEGSNKPETAVVFTEDTINNLVLKFTQTMDVRTVVGDYKIDVEWDDDNYEVQIDGDITEGTRKYGKYVVEKRKIIITLSASLSSEYGDDVMPDSTFGTGWTARRPDNKTGEPIVNGDELTLDFIVYDRDGNRVDNTYPVDTYALAVSSDTHFNENYNVEIKAASEYVGSVKDHAGEVFANYNIVPRKIIVQFSGTSEYGDPIVVKDSSHRANGKAGDAIVNGDKLGYSWTWRDGNPSVGGRKPSVGTYNIDLSDEVADEYQKARDNYDIAVDHDNSLYTVTPRGVTVHVKDIVRTYGDSYVDPNAGLADMLEVRRTKVGAEGAPIFGDDIRFFKLEVIDGDSATLTNSIPFYAGVYNYDLVYTDNNANYDVTIDYGHYTVQPKPITVTIDSKTSQYADDIRPLTHGAIEGVLNGDELNIMLNVLWNDEELGLEWHNVGTYAIAGLWSNPNYAVTFRGELGEHGAYVITKAENMFTKGYDGNGTVYLGDNYRDGDLPTALWGNDNVRYEYYLDAAMTQKADISSIADATEAGTYYVRAIVDEDANWLGAVTTFSVNVVDAMSFHDGLDITLYVCIYASQFIILSCALIFIRRKKEKNKNTNTTKAGN